MHHVIHNYYNNGFHFFQLFIYSIVTAQWKIILSDWIE